MWQSCSIPWIQTTIMRYVVLYEKYLNRWIRTIYLVPVTYYWPQSSTNHTCLYITRRYPYLLQSWYCCRILYDTVLTSTDTKYTSTFVGTQLMVNYCWRTDQYLRKISSHLLLTHLLRSQQYSVVFILMMYAQGT